MTNIEELIKNQWGIETTFPLEKIAPSKERYSWRITPTHWLTRVDGTCTSFLKEEHRLMEDLFSKLIEDNATIAAPKICKTLQGEKIFSDEDYSWRITLHIPDELFNPGDRVVYPLVVKALNELHSALQKLKPNYQLLPLGVLDTVTHQMPRSIYESLNPHIRRAAFLLEEHISLLENFPKVLTHGNLSAENIIIKRNGHIKIVSGIVDYSMLKPDPLIMDYAQILINIICFSGAPDRQDMVQETLHHFDYQFSLEELQTAMIAYWLEQLIRFKNLPGQEKKVAMRIHQILDFQLPS